MTPSASRVVRVFVSSTFLDFGEERDLLVKRVFPELRRRARARFVEVIGVDLRWGITEEESQKCETLPICLREIERSRPYFIGLLGERYGWTPAAGQYPAELLERQPWLAEHAGGKSVTELEILHGVLNSPEMASRAYFCFRDPAWSEGKGDGFRSEGADERARLARLKERIRASPFPVAEYATPEAIADRITEDLWRLIDAEYPEREVPDELERERRSHEAYAHERRRLYVGQEETVSALLARLEGASDEKGDEAAARTRMTLVSGESGTGKSALIANTLERYRQAHPDHVVIEHYIGSTTDAADPAKLMRRIAGEIRKLTESTREIEDDPEQLAKQFPEWLADASCWAGRNGARLVIALDALDKLSGSGGLGWLPWTTAPHLRLVLSSLACEARETLEKRGVDEIEARPFTKEVAQTYLVETLDRRGRRLPKRLIGRIIAHPRATLPIYIKTLVEELSVFASHEGLPDRITECLAAQEPDGLFEVTLARIERDLGQDKVRKLLEAIWASSDGMSEDELLEYTGVAPLDLARLRLSLDDALYAPEGRVRFSHAYMSRAVERRCLPTDEKRCGLHLALGLWWAQRAPSARMARAVNFHLYQAGAWDHLAAALIKPPLGIHLLAHERRENLLRSWHGIAQARSVESVAGLLSSAFDRAWPDWLRVLEDLSVLPFQLADGLIAFLHFAGAGGSPVASTIREMMLASAREQVKRDQSPSALRDLALSLINVAQGHADSGKIQSARELYEEVLGIAERRNDVLESRQSRRELSIALNRVASVSMQQGSLERARSANERSVQIARELFDECDDYESLTDLIVAIDGQGRLAELCRDFSAAGLAYDECLKLAERRQREAPSEDAQRGLCTALNKAARLHQWCERFDAALANYRRICDIMDSLIRNVRSPEDLHGLSIGLQGLGAVHKQRSELHDALKCFQRSLEIARQLSNWVGSWESHRSLRINLERVASLEAELGNIRAAMDRMREAERIAVRLHDISRTPQSENDLVYVRGRLAWLDGLSGLDGSPPPPG
jgi:tetratricopeptide (TPR) repeat protein